MANDNKPFFSIVAPIYKVEKYLSQCVESVLGQTFSDFELILVDDGSPDSCPQLCDDFADQDKRIRVIHKQNGGLSDARNFGTIAAEGKYIIYLDSDDYWAANKMLENLHETLLKSPDIDIINFMSFGFHDGNPNNKFFFSIPDNNVLKNLDYPEAIYKLVEKDWFKPTAWNKVVRKEILEGISFTKGIVSEDIDWYFAVVLAAKKIVIDSRVYYAYRVREGSITNTLGEKNIRDLYSIIEKWATLLRETDCNPKIKKALLGYCSYQLSILLGLCCYLEDKQLKKEYLERISRMKWVWDYAISPKSKKVSRMVKYLGVENTQKALSLFIQVRKKLKLR